MMSAALRRAEHTRSRHARIKTALWSEITSAVRGGLTGVEAAKRFGVSKSTVSRACHANGLIVADNESCLDRALSKIANAQRRSWADPANKARRIACSRRNRSQ